MSCYSLNSIASSYLLYAFSYSPLYAGVIAGSVSIGIVTITGGGGGGIIVIIVVIKWRKKRAVRKKGVRKPEQEEKEAGNRAVDRQDYAALDFADRHPIPPPPSDMFVVTYAEVGQA